MLTVITPATNTNLVQLQTVKDQLGITDSSSDTVLTELIAEASAAVVSYCGRPFAQEVYSETLPGYNSNWLLVSRTPLLNVTQILYNGAPLDPTTYTIEEPLAGGIFSPVPWFWTTELGVSVGIWGNILPNSEVRRYQVNYTAGYTLPGDATQTTPLPRDIEFATLDAVRDWYLSRKRDGTLYQKRVGDLLLAYQPRQTPTGLSPRAERLLQKWVRLA